MTDLSPILRRIADGQPVSSSLFPSGFLVTVTTDPATNDDLIKVSQATGDHFLSLGRWRLRFPRDPTVPDPQSPTAKPLLALIRVKAAGTLPSGRFEFSLSGLELVSDPDHVYAARLVESPYTHLVQAPADVPRRPVVFRGPGVRLDLDLSPTAPAWPANAVVRPLDGSTPSRFVPLLRCDPPHALLGEGTVGLSCEAVELFLDGTSAPTGQTAPWRGLFLPQLGLYFNNHELPDTWSGMTRLRNFALSLVPPQVSGQFAAEIVHHVVFEPQIRVNLRWIDNQLTGGEQQTSDVGDFTVPTPRAGYRYRSVRPSVELNWDQHPEHSEHYTPGGYRVRWTPPIGGQVETPSQLDDDDLGWVRLPPGIHTFAVEVGDYRVGTLKHTFHVSVDGSLEPLRILLEAAPQVPGNLATEGPRFRLQAPLQLGQRIMVSARVFSGFQGPATATLSAVAVGAGQPLPLPANVQQTLTPPDRWDENETPATWTIDIPAGGAGLATHGVLVVDVTQDDANGNPTTATRRLRYKLSPPPAAGAPDLRLEPLLDWQDRPGPGLATMRLAGGAVSDGLVWELEWAPATDSIFADAAADQRFLDGATFPSGESVLPAVTSDTCAVDLHTSGQLWRLTARLPGQSGATRPRPPVVVGEPPSSARLGLGGAGLASNAVATPWIARSGADSAVVFPLNRSRLGQSGEEELAGDLVVHRRSGSDTLALQARGLAALLDAVYAHAAATQTIDLYGSASSEGQYDHNAQLGVGRANAVSAFLSTAMTSGPAAAYAAAGLTVPTGLTFPSDYAAVTGALAGKLSAHGLGTLGASVALPRVDADDRRVFALLRLTTAPSTALQAQCFFATLSGEPPLRYDTRVRLPARRDHPLQHRWFRQARLDVELLRNRLLRAQIAVTVDVKAFKDNQDVASTTELPPVNAHDGVMSFVLAYREIPGRPGTPSRFRWQAEVVADPQDLDGLALLAPATGSTELEGGARALAASGIFLPAVIALQGGRSSALAAAAGVAGGVLLTTIQPAVIIPRKLVWRGGRGAVEYGRGAAPTFRIGVDYEVEYSVNVDLAKTLGLPIEIRLRTTKPVVMTFKNLGVTFTPGQAPTFDYTPAEGFSLQINDPGLFNLGDNPVGRVLQIQSVDLRAGSPLSLETELKFAFETGFFEIDGVRIRATLDMARLFAGGPVVAADVAVEITKIGARANIPGVLAGGGSIEIGNPIGGSFDLSLVPVKLRVYGGFRLFTEPDFRALYVAVGAEFSPGILLGASGVAIKGLEGLVGVNINRNDTDPRRVLDWYRKPQAGATDPAKWTARRGGFAFGVGALLGTAADGGFVWSIKGTLIVELPGPRLLLAARSRFLVTEDQQPRASDNSNVALEGGLLTTVLLDFENGVFAAQAELRLERKKIITVTFPVDIFFNLKRPQESYLRFGQYAPPGGKLIEAKVLDFLDVWSYLQIEGNGFHSNRLNLEGFCVAHGSRGGFLFGAKPWAWFEAYLEYHVGLQLRPLFLEGIIEVGGSIGVVGISVGATATLTVKAPDPWYLHAKVCGHVRVLWWTVEGCAELGPYVSGPPVTPPPEMPLRKVSFVDRRTGTPLELPSPGFAEVPIDAIVRLEFDKVVWAPEEKSIARFGTTPRRNAVTADISYEFDLANIRLTNNADATDTRAGDGLWAGFAVDDLADGSLAPPPLDLMGWRQPKSPPPNQMELSAGERQVLTTRVTELCTIPPPVIRRVALIDGLPLGAAPQLSLIGADLLPSEILCPGAGGLASEWATGPAAAAPLATVAEVVPLPTVDYNERSAKDLALRLPAVRDDPLPDLDQLASTIKTLPPDQVHLPGSTPLPQIVDPVVATTSRVIDAVWRQGASPVGRAVLLSQLIIMTLPDVVSAEVVILLPPGATGGGALWLGATGAVLSKQTKLQQTPPVPGSTGSGTFAGWTAHSVTFLSLDPLLAAQRARTLVIVGTLGRPGYLTETRAVTYRDWWAAEAEATRRQDTVTTLTTQSGLFADPPTPTNRPLLTPGATYRIDGLVRWRRYRKALPDGSGEVNLATLSEGPTLTFKTTTVAPQSLEPYVATSQPNQSPTVPGGLLIDPADDRVPHYIDEPVLVTFRDDTVDALYARFGQRLVTRAKASRGGARVISYTADVTKRVFVPTDAWEETLQTASRQAPCLGNPILPKSQLSLTGLEPNTPYTLTIVSQPVVRDAQGKDVTPVPTDDWVESVILDPARGALLRLNFRTSRFRSFVEQVGRYRTDDQGRPVPELDMVGGDPTRLAATLASLGTEPLIRADDAVDMVSAALVGGPIEPPLSCEVTRLWTMTTTAGGGTSFGFAGLLLDGPEPLLRFRSDGTPQVTVNPPTGWRVVTGVSGARLFLLAPSPSSPQGAGASASVAFSYQRGSEPAQTASMTVALTTEPPSE
jgi:hypothetical protein